MFSRLQIVVTGFVQGVNFRSSTVAQARKLGLTGWVRNRPDGSAVEIVAEGEEEPLQEFLMWASIGPKGAKVKNIEFQYLSGEQEYADFSVAD